jgi:hypothetical protein
MELRGSRTEANLKEAFAGESQARNKYTYFASVARKEGFEHWQGRSNHRRLRTQTAPHPFREMECTHKRVEIWMISRRAVITVLVASLAVVVTLLLTIERYGSLTRLVPAEPHTQEIKTLTYDVFQLRYPGNWYVDENDRTYDPGARFDINAPGQGKVIFMIYRQHAPLDLLTDTMVQRVEKTISEEQRSEFTQWGNHSGYGVELTGMIGAAPGKTRIFSASSTNSAFTAIEVRLDKDEERNKKAYQFIADSFVLKDFQ